MKNIVAFGIALPIFALVQHYAYADIVWDESINGDATNISFSQSVTPTQVSTSLGNNLIIGSRISTVSSGISDSDLFSFEIAEGMVLESITLNVIDIGYQGTLQTWFEQVWNLFTVSDFGVLQFNEASPFAELATVTEIGNTLGEYTVSQFNFGTELGSGIYVLAGMSDTKSGDPRATVNYQWEIQVATIPIPAAFWLFLSSVAGLFALKRTKT
jgi:hypothetical protein